MPSSGSTSSCIRTWSCAGLLGFVLFVVGIVMFLCAGPCLVGFGRRRFGVMRKAVRCLLRGRVVVDFNFYWMLEDKLNLFRGQNETEIST